MPFASDHVPVSLSVATARIGLYSMDRGRIEPSAAVESPTGMGNSLLPAFVSIMWGGGRGRVDGLILAMTSTGTFQIKKEIIHHGFILFTILCIS